MDAGRKKEQGRFDPGLQDVEAKIVSLQFETFFEIAIDRRTIGHIINLAKHKSRLDLRQQVFLRKRSICLEQSGRRCRRSEDSERIQIKAERNQ